MVRLATATLAVLIVAGSSSPAPVSIEGTSTSLSSLTGKWMGQYESAATGRSGSIIFNLRPDGQTATGDVMMFSRIIREPYDPNRPAYAAGSPSAQVLKITFVRAAGGEIHGKLDPYKDPDNGSTLNTTFSGKQVGDSIEGTFESWSSNTVGPQRGTWKVKRQM